MIINIDHEMCDYTCMWNGLEDIYRNKTKTIIPQYLFFGLSGFCNFVYLNISKSEVPKAVYWNNGKAKKMYEFMSDKVGFLNSSIENRSFKYSLNKVKEEINKGNPVVIGCLDMYFLEYLPKFFGQLHIPIHYVLVVGYDDKENIILLYDCSREGIQKLSYENLEKAWNVNVEGFSKKNTLHTFEFNEILNDVKTIYYKGLEEKYRANIYSPVNFIGVKGIQKLSKDILNWEKQMDNEVYQKCLLHLVEYAGFPPSLPDKVNLPDVRHTGARLEFSELLRWGASEYKDDLLQNSAEYFYKSGKQIETLVYEIFNSIENKDSISVLTKDILTEISTLEHDGFKEIEKIFN